MKKGTPLEFDVDTNTQNDAIFEAEDTSTFNSQKTTWEAQLQFFVFPFAYKRHVSHLSTNKNKKTHSNWQKNRGRKFTGRCFPCEVCSFQWAVGPLVLRVPEDLPLDLVVLEVDFWVKPWGVWGGHLLMAAPKTLGGAETPGVSAVFFSWLIPLKIWPG